MARLPGLSIPCGLAEGLRSGCSSWPQSPRTCCSARDTLSSWRSASTTCRSAFDDLGPVIGLEIHVQLKTRTKMFCRCANSAGEEPNTQRAQLPRLPGRAARHQSEAVEWTVKLGLALGCAIAERAIFARKNYFYPDSPKGYQISQYEEPLCVDGHFVVPGATDELEVGIVRAHLEEDAAKTIHVGGTAGRIHGAETSLVDFNRAGRRSSRSSPTRHPFRRGGEALPAAPPPDGCRARHLRRRDGEGLSSVRRERLGARGW